MQTWLPVLFLYLLVLLVIHRLKKPSSLFGILRLPPKTSWLVAGIVLFVTVYSTSSAGLISGIVTEKGPADLLIVWASLIPLGFLPLVFAPLWAKLNFISENEFLTLRFAEPWASRLRKFRAWYVGLIVVPILLSFALLSFTDVLIVYLDLEKSTAILLIAALVVLNALRASYREKAVFDLLHFAAFVVPIIVVVVSLWNTPEQLQLDFSNKPFLPEPLTLFAFIGVQWWSAQIIDGSGIEAQQLMGTSKRKAVKTTLVMCLCMVLVSSLVFYISIHAGGIDFVSGQQAYLAVIHDRLPAFLLPVMAIGMFGVFISTFEAIQLWGAGLIVEEFHRNRSEKNLVRITRGLMMGSAILSGVVSWQADSLSILLELLLGLTAGVGLLYILRWFWWRVNAQTQLIAMILPTLLMIFHQVLPKVFPRLLCMENMSYPSILLMYTGISVFIAAVSMWLTNNDKDRDAYHTFSNTLEIDQKKVLVSILYAIVFGFALFALQLMIAYFMLPF